MIPLALPPEPASGMVYITVWLTIHYAFRLTLAIVRCPYVKEPPDKVMSLVRVGLEWS